jgi:alanine racemase
VGDKKHCISATVSKVGEAFASTRAEIYLDRFEGNVRRVKGFIGPRVELMAVVKADGYGHGAIATGRTALASGAHHLAVYTLAEALSLRKGGVDGSIVVLGPIYPDQAATCISHGITPCISSRELGQAIAAAAISAGTQAAFHVEIDTGLTRYGVLPEEAVPLVAALDKLPGLRREGLFTHFAKADEEDKTSVWKQFRVFSKVRLALNDAGLTFRVYHVAASAATLDFPEMHLDLVRCGISLYGYYPSSYVSRSVGLEPVLALGSQLARVHDVSKGVGVSYGHDWTATRKSRIGLVPFGYADGMPRTVQGKAHVLVRGRRAPIAGRVAMDQFMIDLSRVPDAQEGDPVTIIGTSGEDEITADEIGEWAGTISYDVLSGISTRVPRLYIEGGRPVAKRLGMTMELLLGA